MLRTRFGLAVGYLIGLLGIVSCIPAVAQGTYIAGLKPAHRPDGAPKVVNPKVSEEAAERRLFGIIKPVPDNLAGIAATGAWFVPLRSPGMHGPYDLRGWHAQPKSLSNAAAASASQ